MIVNRTARDELVAAARMVHQAETWEDLAGTWPGAIDAIRRSLKILEKRRLRYASGELSDEQARRLKGVYLGIAPKLALLRWRFLRKFEDERWAIEESWILGPLLEQWHEQNVKGS